ncbi:MAG: thioredoxin family protein, partial [Planctomycetota bacterium]|nr:thioredoxin family protein [Planctomycetota bacterium]
FGAPLARKIKLYSLAAALLVFGWVLPFRWFSTIDKLTLARVEKEDLIYLGRLAREGIVDVKTIVPPDWSEGEIKWFPYKRDRAMNHVKAGYTVFVDYTANWCGNCKTNLVSAINRNETIKVMRELNVVPYEADYTNDVPEITADLKRFKSGGVPMYLVYKPGDPDNPEILPVLLPTPQILNEALRRAGPSRPDLDALDNANVASATEIDQSTARTR